jgi:hypothetical protein
MSENATETADDRREAQRKEYGRYVAAESISIDGALAFRAGDPVPVSHVESGVVDKSQVVGASSKKQEN